MESTRKAEHLADNEKAQVTHDSATLPSGLPYPSIYGNVGVTPAVLVVPPTADEGADPEKAAAVAEAVARDRAKMEDGTRTRRTSFTQPESYPITEKHRPPVASSTTDSSSSNVSPKKPYRFGRSRKNKEEKAKKAAQKEEEADVLKPVGIIGLFRFAKPVEVILMVIGLLLAAAAGAAQPLMTLIFGRLTTSFTAFAIASNQIAQSGSSPEVAAAIASAKASLKSDSGHNALYLLAIGLGMFVATWSYMFIWNYTGELLSKRVRENYLRAVLRQEIAYFDDLGAGEVATRIQTDCHLVQDGTSERVAIIVQYLSTFVTGFVLAFARGWRLALALSSILPVIVATGAIMMGAMTKFSTDSLENIAKAGTIAEEVIGSIRTIQAFGTTLLLGKKFNERIENSRRSGQQGTAIEAGGLATMCAFLSISACEMLIRLKFSPSTLRTLWLSFMAVS